MVYQIIIFYIPMLLLLVFVGYMIYKRSQYRNKANAGAFFFEDNNLVLNTGIPYAVAFDQIDRVELHYNSWELEHQLSYSLSVKVFQKTGSQSWYFIKAIEQLSLHCLLIWKQL